VHVRRTGRPTGVDVPAIFISHSSRDQQVSNDVTTAIKRLGFEEVFLDFDKDSGIGAGADWE